MIPASRADRLQAKCVTIFSDTKACFFCERSLDKDVTDNLPLHLQQYVYEEICPFCQADNSVVWAFDDLTWLDSTNRIFRKAFPDEQYFDFSLPDDTPPSEISSSDCLFCEANGKRSCSCNVATTFFDFEEVFSSEGGDLDQAYAYPSLNDDGFVHTRPFCDSCVHQGTASCKPLREWAVLWYSSAPDQTPAPIIPCLFYEYFSPFYLEDEEEKASRTTRRKTDKYLDTLDIRHNIEDLDDPYSTELIDDDIFLLKNGELESIHPPMSSLHTIAVLRTLTEYLMSIDLVPIPPFTPQYEEAFRKKLFDSLELLGHIQWAQTEIEYKWLQDALAILSQPKAVASKID